MSNLVPEGWKSFKIREMLSKVIDNRGKTPPLSGRGHDLIEIACVRKDRQYVDYEKTTKYVTEETYQTWFRNGHPNAGDTLAPTVGSIGEFAFVRKNKGCIAQNLVALRPSEVIFPLFLYFQCYSEVVQKNISRILMGAVQPSLRVPHFLETSVLLPALPEQKKIASILTSVDEVIENTQKQIDKLQDLKKATMNELLTKGIGHTEFKDSKLGQIPVGWEVQSLLEVATNGISNGVFNDPKKQGGDYRLINVYDMYQGFGIDVQKLSRLELSEKEFLNNRVKHGDIFLTRSSLKLEGIAHCNICLSESESLTYDGHLMKITPNKLLVEPIYLALQCLSDAGRIFLMRMAKQSTMTTIGQQDIAPLPILLPPSEEQREIISIHKSFEVRLKRLKIKLSQTQSIKKALMQDLLTGKVRVTVN